jgi:hypothetical protein
MLRGNETQVQQAKTGNLPPVPQMRHENLVHSLRPLSGRQISCKKLGIKAGSKII